MSLSEEWKKELNNTTSNSQKWKSEIIAPTTPKTHADIAKQTHDTMDAQRNQAINQNVVPNNTTISEKNSTNVGDVLLSTLYGIGEKPAKAIANATFAQKSGPEVYREMGLKGMQSNAQQELIALGLKRKGYSDDEIQNYLNNVTAKSQEEIDKINDKVQKEQEELNKAYKKIDSVLGKNEIAKDIGNTIGYLGLGPTTGYGVLSAINARADTDDPLDIAMAAGTGEVFGTISNKLGGLTKGALGKIGATNTNIPANIVKNFASGFAGTGGASLATGTVNDIYNAARGRDINYLNTLENSATSGLIGGLMQGVTGTINDVKQAKAQMQSDYRNTAQEVENMRNYVERSDAKNQSQKVKDAIARKYEPRIEKAIEEFKDTKYLGQNKAQAKLVEQLKQGNTTPVQVQNTNATLALPEQAGQSANKATQNNIQNVSENQKIVPQNVESSQNVVENVPKAIETPLTQPAQTMSNNVENTLNSNNDMYSLRDFKEVGNRKVNAYQYDNPAVKPYFQQAAREMLSDLRDSVKGERYMTQVDGETNFGGQPRITTADIASLLDGDNGVKLSYDDIEKGLKAIIEDHGAENNAKSKRIEFALDNRLRNGYTLADGMEIPANEEYLNFLQDSNQSPISMSEIQEGYTRLYRGINGKYDPNYDKSLLDNSNGYESWTDNYDLAKSYGDNVYYTDIPTNQISNSVIDENPNSDTYGDRNLIYKNDKPVGINGKSGNEYMLYTDHDNYPNIKYNEVANNSQPSNIFEETNQMIENNRNQQLEESSKALALEKETPKVSTPVEEKKIKSLVDIANMTEEDIKQEKGVTYKHKADKNTPYQRKFFENMESSKIISDDVKDRVDMTSYERKANEATLERVNLKLDENGDKLIKEWERKTKNFTDEDVALGAILIQRYQQQGDIESAVDVVQKLADMGTEAGRAVQMYSIFQRLTPEAMMVYQQRKLDAVFDNIKQKKTGDWVDENKEKFKLTAEDAQFIQEQVEKAQNAETERQKQIELAKIEKRINDKLPPEAGQSIKALRRIAMLFNPKTQVRNIVGNTLIKPVNMVADFVGTQIDKAIARKTGVRTTNYTDLKSEAQGFKKGIKESIEDYKLGIRTEPTGSKYEFEIGGKPFNENTKSEAVNAVNRKLNGVNNLLSAVMSGGDRPFYEAAFNNSLQGQMKANNVDVPTSDMIDIATNEALQRTWNDNNSYTQAVLGIRSAMNKLNIKGFGLGDLIIPFAKTPANLTKAMVEYSPAGFVESLIDFNDMRKAISRGEMTPQQQKKFVSSTSKAIAGTILYAIAGSLVKSGTITGSKDKDKDVANFEQNVLGIQPYSVKIGDKTFTYSWANPLNFPLAVMADTYKMSKENAKLSEILYNGFKVAGDTLLDNSFLQGIKKLFESDSLADGLVDAVADMPNQFVPTFMKQLADLADDTKRQSFEYNDLQQTTINKAKAKIPGLKNELAPQVNTFGEEIKNYGGDNNPFNIFFNPANISKSNATESQKALYDLYQETKDKTIFPRQAPYYVSNKGEKINLSSQDRAEYQKTSGEYVTRELDALFDSDFYKTLTNDQKVDVVNKIVSDADTKGKDKWVDSESTEKLAKLEKDLDGIPMVDYYNAWIAQKGIESDKNYQGKTITNSKSKKQKAAVDKATPDLTQKQREILYDMFSIGKSVW